jgi:RNA polymerase sigma-70 factor (sigma-E family)
MSGNDPEQFVRAHADELLRSAVLLTHNRAQAEDLVHETLVRLLPKWERVAQAQAPLAYFRRSMVNRFVSQRRLRSSHDVPVWDVPEGVTDGDLGDGVALKAAVWALLGTLPARHRAALVLRYYDDLPDADIAAILGCRIATVRSMVSRALNTLRSMEPATASTEEAR